MSDYENMIFLSYASEDRDRVAGFYNFLSDSGFNVWMDFKNIKPGHNWDYEIQRAFSKSSIIILFLSNNSEKKRGYIQREIKFALKNMEEKLPDDIYLIPVLLDREVVRPDYLSHLQMVSGYESNSKFVILDAVKHQFIKYGSAVKNFYQEENLSWSFSNLKETWEGLPGYEVEVDFLNINSSKYKDISYINSVVNADSFSAIMDCRSVRMRQDADIFSYAQEPFSRTNSTSVKIGSPIVVGKALSLVASHHFYSAGAAHGLHGVKTFNFCLNPLFQFNGLGAIIKESDDAFSAIRDIVRKKLNLLINPGESDFKDEMILQGTQSREKLSNYSFSDKGIEFVFASYQVGVFALGTPVVLLEYDELRPLLKDFVRHLLLGC